MERTISVLGDVKDLGELLDGASIDAARIVPLGGRLQLEMELTRAMPERQRVVRQGLFRRVKTPWVKSRLMLNQITDVTVQRMSDTPAEQQPLLACDAIPGGYRFVVTAPDGLQLQLTLEQLSGNFADISATIESP